MILPEFFVQLRMQLFSWLREEKYGALDICAPAALNRFTFTKQ